MINIVRCCLGGRGYDQAIAPTGCAASLLKGATACRALKIPVGKKAKDPPSDLHLPSQVDFQQAFTLEVCSWLALLKDEHSMESREAWAWLRQRLESARKFEPQLESLLGVNEPRVDTASVGRYEWRLAKIQHDAALKESYQRPYGGVPFIGSFGDCHQLPPVAAKAHYDKGKASASNHACAAGRVAFSDFLDPPPDSNCHGITFVMDKVQRQTDGPFKVLLQKMREGTITTDDTKLLVDRHWPNLTEAEQVVFEKEALYIFPTWKRTKPITIKYLLSLAQPVAKIRSQYDYKKVNHAKNEVNLPDLSALCSDATVMLLMNYIVELGLKNGSIGTIVDIVYDDPEGPANRNALPLYVVVDFPSSTIPVLDAWDSEHPTWIPIPVASPRCDSKCCTQSTIPLRVCKAITIYKSQGITVGVGDECVWKYVVIGLSGPDERRSSPGQELVAFSRAQEIEYMAIADDVEITQETFCKIGTGKAADAKRKFEQDLRSREEQSQQWIKLQITALDCSNGNGPKTFEGGYQHLCNWYQPFHEKTVQLINRTGMPL